MKKIKICQICAVDFTFKYFLKELLKEQKKQGWDVTCVSSPGKYLQILKKNKFSINEINISRSFNFFLHIKTIISLVIYFRKKKFDIIHVHTPIAAILVRVSNFFFSDSKIIYTAHGFYFHENMNKIYFLFHVALEKLLCKNVDLLFVQSKEDYLFAKNNNFVNKKKLFKIGNGIDLKKFNKEKINKKAINLLKNKYSIKKNDFVIGFVGRLVKDKGIIDFLKVVKNLFIENKKIVALLVGGHLKNEHSQNIFSEIKVAKKLMGDKLVITGFKDDIPNYLSIVNVFCLPSYREGLPRSVIEAMAMEIPVVSYNIRGCRELVLDNRTGFLVQYKNCLLLEKKINFLINNPHLAKIMGKFSRSVILKKNNEKNIVNLQILLTKKLCA